MTDIHMIDRVRHSLKSALNAGHYPWLSNPARHAWYLWRTMAELARVPSVLNKLRQSAREGSLESLVEFAFNEFDGLFRPFQNKNELLGLLRRVANDPPGTIVEIGTARGGSLFLLSCVAKTDARIISIDLPAGLYGGGYPLWKGMLFRRMKGQGQQLRLLRGDSHSAEMVKRAEAALAGASVDVLFIDADHSYQGVKKDFLSYRHLARPGGLIVFHDILDNISDRNINVAPLWREVSRRWETETIIDSPNQGQFGIGLLHVPPSWEE